MRKSILSVFVVAMIAALAFTLCACGSREPILGKWTFGDDEKQFKVIIR